MHTPGPKPASLVSLIAKAEALAYLVWLLRSSLRFAWAEGFEGLWCYGLLRDPSTVFGAKAGQTPLRMTDFIFAKNF